MPDRCDYLQVMLSETEKSAIDLLLKERKAFALFVFPGENELHWCLDGDSRFEIVEWLHDYGSRIPMSDSLLYAEEVMPVESCQTSYEEYISGVRRVIDNCAARGGKTVYSRVICGECNGATVVSWGEVASRLFELHRSAFRFVYYTPSTGAWLGATPELLLDYDLDTGRFSTVSLAGTRKSGCESGWDEKNICENKYVSDFIVDNLVKLGITADVSPLQTVGYGGIEHLCATISGKAETAGFAELLDTLSPTPALCGWPKKDAIEDIKRYERHSRGCYGGYLLVREPRRIRAFVNLRCVHFDQKHYCVFGGGGITPMSDPDDEFAETTAKTSALVGIIESCRH